MISLYKKFKNIFFILLTICTCFSQNVAGTPVTQTFGVIEMVKIPEGKIKSFWMGKYEITQKQYTQIIDINPSSFQGDYDKPVERVSWYNAIYFCNKLSIRWGYKPYYNIDITNPDPQNISQIDNIKWTVTINRNADGFRLPTSEEWEYAYRARTTTKFYWGDNDDFSVIDQYAVYLKNSGDKGEGNSDYGTHKVGTKKPNGWGLYDMAGNVVEWCYDVELSQYFFTRVLRGGHWGSYPKTMEAGIVLGISPNESAGTVGFRVAKNL